MAGDDCPARQFARRSITAARPSPSRLVGSSSRRKCGSAKMRAASPTRVRCPPESAANGVSGRASSPERPSAEAVRAFRVQSATANSSTLASPPSARRRRASPSFPAERVRDRFVWSYLNELAQDVQSPVDRYLAGLGQQIAGNQLQQRGLSHTISSDKPGPGWCR